MEVSGLLPRTLSDPLTLPDLADPGGWSTHQEAVTVYTPPLGPHTQWASRQLT